MPLPYSQTAANFFVDRLENLLSNLYLSISAMLFSDKGVDKNLISWNRVVLLHGPPGMYAI